jgi:hypothetical protein
VHTFIAGGGGGCGEEWTLEGLHEELAAKQADMVKLAASILGMPPSAQTADSLYVCPETGVWKHRTEPLEDILARSWHYLCYLWTLLEVKGRGRTGRGSWPGSAPARATPLQKAARRARRRKRTGPRRERGSRTTRRSTTRERFETAKAKAGGATFEGRHAAVDGGVRQAVHHGVQGVEGRRDIVLGVTAPPPPCSNLNHI